MERPIVGTGGEQLYSGEHVRLKSPFKGACGIVESEGWGASPIHSQSMNGGLLGCDRVAGECHDGSGTPHHPHQDINLEVGWEGPQWESMRTAISRIGIGIGWDGRLQEGTLLTGGVGRSGGEGKEEVTGSSSGSDPAPPHNPFICIIPRPAPNLCTTRQDSPPSGEGAEVGVVSLPWTGG